jgi:hypothetical protein
MRGSASANGVEGRRQVDREDLVPFGEGNSSIGRDVLDAGVVHQDVDAAEDLDRVAHHGLDGFGLAHVRVVVASGHPVLACDAGADLLDLRRRRRSR